MPGTSYYCTCGSTMSTANKCCGEHGRLKAGACSSDGANRAKRSSSPAVQLSSTVLHHIRWVCATNSYAQTRCWCDTSSTCMSKPELYVRTGGRTSTRTGARNMAVAPPTYTAARHSRFTTCTQFANNISLAHAIQAVASHIDCDFFRALLL